MSTRTQSHQISSIYKVILQIGLLILIWWIGSIIQKQFNLPISAAVIGLFMVLIGLMTGIFKLNWIKSGSDFILGELVLFFIPCFIGLMKYKNLFMTEGWQLIVVVVLGTICVMVFTAYSVHIGFKLERKLKQRHDHKTVHVLQGDK
ncbi:MULTISPECIES: CidA/LrgA family protein [Acinetobacter]|jgi:holin-like protein|uniref:CidA/LrgA family protein n=1 Tax=Acinetobacter guillouiae TaxID=106649 RepID=A0A8X8GHG5_ACIGI|nr:MULTISPECIES: CidA/LrgA family protein [Acinetobacter]MCF0265188.1 CidA/LrgA family protein [Acinetobacter guillouiae]MCS4296736.1 holin-like protein [Acinetobacter guillouiae]MCW2250858.1 holin-like protein [Acinetobacter sp. BIGb0204]NII37044.1 holin-like protein [Acinetobacter sp. BIGb0196]QLD60264.1 CidA/LrgA family protein [Acinetobacter sp. MYb10]